MPPQSLEPRSARRPRCRQAGGSQNPKSTLTRGLAAPSTSEPSARARRARCPAQHPCSRDRRPVISTFFGLVACLGATTLDLCARYGTPRDRGRPPGDHVTTALTVASGGGSARGDSGQGQYGAKPDCRPSAEAALEKRTRARRTAGAVAPRCTAAARTTPEDEIRPSGKVARRLTRWLWRNGLPTRWIPRNRHDLRHSQRRARLPLDVRGLRQAPP